MPEAAMNAIAPSQISFREILVATDLSSASVNALNYAKIIATRYSSHVVVVHVCQPTSYLAIPEGGWVEDTVAQKAEEEIEALGAELRAEGYETEVINASGSIKDEVMSLAKAHDADLVVLGTHGKHGIERLLFGSEAEALIHYCDRPVLTVGPAAEVPRKNTWLLNQIVCAAAPGTYSAKAAAYGYRLAQENGADFTLFCAEDPGYALSPENWRAFEDAFNKELPGGDGRPCRIQGYFSSEAPAADIVQAAKKRQADLIVLGAKRMIPGRTHFSWGVLPEILLRAHCPVLTISSN
jgi:nucleotide-binding universal stress UspA family protein